MKREQHRRAVVLAAGQGKRLQSERFNLPKVLREACGKPLLGYVLEKLRFLPPEDVCLVIGYKGEQVRAYAGEAYVYRWQREQLGTGHAVQMALDFLEETRGDVLLCYGDMPLFTEETYLGLFARQEETGADGTVLAYNTDFDLPYGRIIRAGNGDFQQVIEACDCTPEQRKITELNAGVYVFKAPVLIEGLKCLRNNNAQNEYYLTDVPAHVLARGGKIAVYGTRDPYEGYGVNTEDDLRVVEEILRTGRTD